MESLTRTTRAALVAILALLAGRAGAAERGLVLTTFQPLYSMAASVVGDSPALAVVNLAPRHLGPHDFDLEAAPGARELAARALAVVTLRSLPLAPHFDKLYGWARRVSIRIVELDPAWDFGAGAPAFPLLKVPGSEEWNPHVWLAPSLGAAMVRRLGDEIAALDPPRAPRYRAGAEGLARRLLALRRSALARLAEADAPEVVALSEGFPYLAADLGIDVRDWILDAAGPAELEARVRAAGVGVVLAEEAPTAAVRAAVARAGAEVLVLDTLERGWGTGRELRVEGYLAGLRADVDRLVEALVSRSPGRGPGPARPRR